MSNPRLPVFDKFIAELRTVWATDTDDERRMAKAKPLLEKLVMDPTLKAHSADWPSTEGRKNLLFYVDPDHHFVINGVVRVPGRAGSIHDHADAWVLYGVLDGTESLERFDRIDDGGWPGYAEVKLSSITTGSQGKVDLVPPRAIHAEQGGPTRSVAVIVRSQKLGEGTVLQHRYDRDTNAVVEQYGPTQIPYELTSSPAQAGEGDRTA
jgi:predicted metal-dependent enzyme (double-stranded beta helix superfamily)